MENLLQREAEINALKHELCQARSMVQALEDEKNFLEQSVEAGQVQKEIFYDETDKIQNVQQQEIVKLKSMLLFREQVIRFSSMSCSILTTFRSLRSRWIMSTSRRTMTHKSKA